MSVNWLATHTRYIVVLLVAILIVVVLRLAYVPLTPNSDYDSYVSTAQLFSGVPATPYPQRILKPLGPLGVAAVMPFTTPRNAFVIEVVFFYVLFAVTFYFLAFEFFENRTAALMAALLGAVSYPMLRYGLDLYTETGAQFFYVLALLGMLRYVKAPSTMRLSLAALAIGFGLLWKEYSVVAGLGLGLIILFESVPVVQKVKNLVILGIGSLLPTVLVQIGVFENYHYSYLDWYKTGGASGFATQYTPKNIVKSVAALLGLGWIAVPWGIKRLGKFGEPKFNFILFSTLASFIDLCWGYVSSRLFFVMAIPFILIAVTALRRLPRHLQWLSMAAILVGNVVWLVIAAHVFGI